MSVIVRYRSNNSGGSWWLSTSDWEALEVGGWNVHWTGADSDITYGNRPLEKVARNKDSFLGAEAQSAAGVFDSVDDAIESFESITGQNAASIGCNCCGPPHSFEWIVSDQLDKDRWNYVYLEEPSSGTLSW